MASISEFQKWVNEQYAKRRKDYGRNRRADTTSQSGAASESNSCTGRAGSQAAIKRAIAASHTHSFQGAGQGASLNDLLIDIQQIQHFRLLQLQQLKALMGSGVGRTPSGKWCPSWMTGELGQPNNARTWTPHPVTHMKSEGLIAGEIIAHRAWYWDPDRERLRSLFVDYEWPVSRPAKGEPARGYGIHAFKNEERPYYEYAVCRKDLLFGTVALWGDVIEYEQGYCAEFARVKSLPDAPVAIKELYGIE